MAAEAEAAREARAKVMASVRGLCVFSPHEELHAVVWRMKILFYIGLWQIGRQGRIFCGFGSSHLLYLILNYAVEISFENVESQVSTTRTNHEQNNFEVISCRLQSLRSQTSFQLFFWPALIYGKFFAFCFVSSWEKWNSCKTLCCHPSAELQEKIFGDSSISF